MKLKSIVKEAIQNICYDAGNIVNAFSPYLMLLIGEVVYRDRGTFTIGGEVFIPIILLCLAYFLNTFGRKSKEHKKNAIPVPNKRFTNYKGHGEYDVEYSRLEEMILYMADLEDYLESRDLL